MDEYATHLPVLAACLAQTKGPVLELGMGSYSTALIHAMCKNRVVVSTDTDPAWIEKFKGQVEHPHSIHLVEHDIHASFSKQLAETRRWGVVFIDHLHNDLRKSDVVQFREHADIVIAHDTDCNDSTRDHCDLNSVVNMYVHKHEYRKLWPYTTALSMTNDLSFL